MDSQCSYDVVGRPWPGLRCMLKKTAYSVVIILAGTNDLAAQFTPSQIVTNLAALHGSAHAAGARSVILTIPESAASQHVKWLGALRTQTNDAIRSWVCTLPKQKVMFVESAALLPYKPGPFWEPDGLHMSKQGYEKFGQHLMAAIKSFVCSEPLVLDAASSAGQSDDGTQSSMLSAPGDADLVPGTRVVIVGLQNACQHNGKCGTLLDRSSGERWGVRLDHGALLSVRAVNIIRDSAT